MFHRLGPVSFTSPAFPKTALSCVSLLSYTWTTCCHLQFPLPSCPLAISQRHLCKNQDPSSSTGPSEDFPGVSSSKCFLWALERPHLLWGKRWPGTMALNTVCRKHHYGRIIWDPVGSNYSPAVYFNLTKNNSFVEGAHPLIVNHVII